MLDDGGLALDTVKTLVGPTSRWNNTEVKPVPLHYLEQLLAACKYKLADEFVPKPLQLPIGSGTPRA